MSTEPALFRHLKGHHGRITGLAFGPDKPSLASCSTDNVAKVWNFDDTTRCLLFEAHKDEVNDVCWSGGEQNLIATASKDRTIRVFVPTMRGESEVFIAHTASVRSVDIDSTGRKLATGSNDKTVKLWKVSHKHFLSSFTGHTNWVRSVRFSPSNKIIGSCADDKTVKLFDVNSKDCIHTFQDRKASGNQIAWHPDGSLVAVGLQNNRIKIYDIKMNELIQYYKINAGPINSIAFHPSGNYLIAGSDDGTIKIIDLHEGRQMYTITSHQGAVTAVKFSPSGEHFASGGEDQHIMIWKSNLDISSSANTSESEKSIEKYAKKLNFNDDDDHSEDKENEDTSIKLDPRDSANYNLSEVIENIFQTNPLAHGQDTNELTLYQLQYDFLVRRIERLSLQVEQLQAKVVRLESRIDL